MKPQAIIAATDMEDLVAFLESMDNGILLDFMRSPPEEKPEKYPIDPECLYIFAFMNPDKKMLAFMATKAGTAPNFLAFCLRPGSGFNATVEELGCITLLSKELIYARATAEIAKATEE